MSLFADYHKEQGVKQVIESEDGFCIYWKLGLECFVGEAYVVPAKRQSGLARDMIDQVSTHAKEMGCKYLTCSTLFRANNSNISEKAVLAVGFKFFREDSEAKYYIKEL